MRSCGVTTAPPARPRGFVCLFLVLLAVLLESLPSLATKELVVLGINGITARLECLLIAADQDHDEGGKVVLVDVRVAR